jgi:formate dehydrogenase
MAGRIGTPDRTILLALPDLLDELRALVREVPVTDAAVPFVLSAGERRSFTANTIIRDPRWRMSGGEGALRLSPADAEALGLTTGDQARLSTRRGSAVVHVEVT